MKESIISLYNSYQDQNIHESFPLADDVDILQHFL
jgi:hypothetical protein